MIISIFYKKNVIIMFLSSFPVELTYMELMLLITCKKKANISEKLENYRGLILGGQVNYWHFVL